MLVVMAVYHSPAMPGGNPPLPAIIQDLPAIRCKASLVIPIAYPVRRPAVRIDPVISLAFAAAYIVGRLLDRSSPASCRPPVGRLIPAAAGIIIGLAGRAAVPRAGAVLEIPLAALVALPVIVIRIAGRTAVSGTGAVQERSFSTFVAVSAIEIRIAFRAAPAGARGELIISFLAPVARSVVIVRIPDLAALPRAGVIPIEARGALVALPVVIEFVPCRAALAGAGQIDLVPGIAETAPAEQVPEVAKGKGVRGSTGRGGKSGDQHER